MALLLALLAGGTSCTGHSPISEGGDYASRITAARADKDAAFGRASDPVPDSGKARLLPLEYFPIEPAYNVEAVLASSTSSASSGSSASSTSSGSTDIFMIKTSTGQMREQRRAGTLEFTLQQQPLQLTAFVAADSPDRSRLFVPFGDTTNGTETYGGGRYVDAVRLPSGHYTLDFNGAYHPNCYYNASYECPLPPPENKLTVAVNAGEKQKNE